MKMKKTTMVAVSVLLFSSALYGQAAAQKAKADLINTKGEHVGKATFTETSKGVRLALNVSNLPAGAHGFHIHTVGKCDPPDFKSAGGHFNPEGKKHGLLNPEGHHAGDLENLIVGADGKANVRRVISGVTLGEGVSSLFHPGGTALVIHADPDDGKTDPAGNAGARIACGVITR
jgi:Cu-Zn family superoxide dismutase